MNKDELMKLEKEEIIALLLGIIEQLNAEIAELKARLNQNSRNSSKPPSSDGFNKPKPKSLRKPSVKSIGGQKGHEGNGFSFPGKIDNTITHPPTECDSCSNKAECKAGKLVKETRYEVDARIETITTAHQTVAVHCPKTKAVITSCFPAHITGVIQYGVNVEALAVALNTVGMVSINRTHEILSGVFGISISTGTISNMVSECAESVAPVVSEIKELLKTEPLIHSDETGTNVDGKSAWAHVASTDKLTLIDVQEKRGQAGMDAIGILTHYTGTVIHDCFAPYFNYDVRHGLCAAHLLRELVAVTENTGQSWAQSMTDLLLAMKKTKEQLLSQGKYSASWYSLEKYSRMYDDYMTDALLHNPVPVREPGQRGRVKRGKAGALVDRLILHKDKYILFFTDFNVPFDNNQAERDIRMFKVKLKVAGCFRTITGAKIFAAITSYVSTARKHGTQAFLAIKEALLNRPVSPLGFGGTE